MTEHAVPRSTEATTPSSAARVAERRLSQPVGWWGMVVFVATEATLFGTIFGTYFYLRFRAVHWPPPGFPEPKVAVPLVLAGVLVATSVPMQLALAAARRAAVARAWFLVLLSLVIQAGYFGMQVHLFGADLDEFTPQDGAYGSIYFTMLGTHHAHVAVGILLDVWLLLRLATGLTGYRLVGLQATVFYWHFVNLLALLVVGAQLSPTV